MTNDATTIEYLKQNGYFDLAQHYINVGADNYDAYLDYLIEKYPDDEDFFNNLNRAVRETAIELYQRRDAINRLSKAGTIKDATVLDAIMPPKDVEAARKQMELVRVLVSDMVWVKNATPAELFDDKLDCYWHLPDFNRDEDSTQTTSSLETKAQNLLRQLDEADMDLIEKIKISESYIVCFYKWISDDVLSALQFKLKFDLIFDPDLSAEATYRKELSEGEESMYDISREEGSVHMYQFLHDLLCKKHNEWVEKAFNYVKSKENLAVSSSEVLDNFVAWIGEQRRGDASTASPAESTQMPFEGEERKKGMPYRNHRLRFEKEQKHAEGNEVAALLMMSCQAAIEKIEADMEGFPSTLDKLVALKSLLVNIKEETRPNPNYNVRAYYQSGKRSAEGVRRYVEESIEIYTDKLEIEQLFAAQEPVEPPQPASITRLQSKLREYGFFDLKPVRELPQPSITKLLDHLNGSELPYKIAMLAFLGFDSHLYTEHCRHTKAQVNTCLAGILEVTSRAVKGNLSVLNPMSDENKERYTAHLHQENAKKYYESLK